MMCGLTFSGQAILPLWQTTLQLVLRSMTSVKYVECMRGGTTLPPTIKSCEYWMVQASSGEDGAMRHSFSQISEDLGRQIKKEYSRTEYFRSVRYMATE